MPRHRAHNKEKDEPCVASKLARRGAAQAKPGVYTVLKNRTFFSPSFFFAHSPPLFLVCPMTSSDDWISSFSSLTIVPRPSSGQSSPGMTILSGGSSASGVYGGGAKRATLFYFDAAAPLLCVGFVGAGCKRVCLKERLSVNLTCGVAKHANKFQPAAGHLYLCGIDTTAYCEPAFDEAIVPPEFRGAVGLSAKSMTEWKELFQAYAE
jgi:hypothetical protein